MPYYPNQETIKIRKDRSPEVKKQLYAPGKFTQSNDEIAYEVMRRTSGNEYKLWDYLNRNAPDFILDLSPAHIQNVTGINKKNLKSREWKKLIDLGYIFEIQPKQYIFFSEGAFPNDTLEQFKQRKFVQQGNTYEVITQFINDISDQQYELLEYYERITNV